MKCKSWCMNGSIFKIIPNLTKTDSNFKKILEIRWVLKIWCKIGPIVYEWVTFFFKLVLSWVYFQILRRHTLPKPNLSNPLPGLDRLSEIQPILIKLMHSVLKIGSRNATSSLIICPRRRVSPLNRVAKYNQKVVQTPEIPLKTAQTFCWKVAVVTSESLNKLPNWAGKLHL